MIPKYFRPNLRALSAYYPCSNACVASKMISLQLRHQKKLIGKGLYVYFLNSNQVTN